MSLHLLDGPSAEAPQLPYVPELDRAFEQEEPARLRAAKGLMTAVVLAVPFWALLGLGAYLLF